MCRLLLKCSTVGIGFNGAETNCGIAHILGILLMNSCNKVIFLATTIICSLSTLNYLVILPTDAAPQFLWKLTPLYMTACPKEEIALDFEKEQR